MLVLLGIGLLAGFVTAISPCVLPVLPILLAGGASGRRPLRIVTGLVASAGPVLAAITVVAASNHVGWRALLLTVAYAVGAAVPMFLIAHGGRGIAVRLRAQGARLRVLCGLAIGLVALGIALNADARF